MNIVRAKSACHGLSLMTRNGILFWTRHTPAAHRGRLWLRSSFGLGFSLALLQKLLLFFSHRTPFRATIGIQELRKLDNGFEVLF